MLCTGWISDYELAGLWGSSGFVLFFFFKQKTAYEIGTGDWSSDVCSSDLPYLEMGGSNVFLFRN